MVDFYENLRIMKEAETHYKWIKEKYCENIDACFIELNEYLYKIEDVKVFRYVVKKLAQKLWVKFYYDERGL